MKLVELINLLREPNNLEQLFSEKHINVESESILIYMESSINVDAEISFFKFEETEDELLFIKDGIQYIQLFPIEYIIELIDSELTLKDKNYSNLEIATRLINYRIKDA
jgi:hypothetical protein